VSADLTEKFTDWEGISAALGEIRACHGDTAAFFYAVVDQVDALYESLMSRAQSRCEEQLRQMCALLETLTRQAAEGKRQVENPPATESAPAAKSFSGVAAAALDDPMLESVLTQFEVLMQDRISRRNENAGCAISR
jgi:hypothetical protein